MAKKNHYKPDEKFGFTDVCGAASLMGLSKSTVYKLTSKCLLPHYKLGSKLTFRISELLQFIDDNRVPIIKN